MKRSSELAGLRALSTMGLPSELYIPAMLEMLHDIVPSLRNLFDWTDAQGNLIRYYFEGPIDHAVAAHYFEEFHNRKEVEAMPAFQQVVTGRAVVHSAEELDNATFFRSALYNEIWRPQGLHTRIEAIVKGVRGQPLGSLVLYRGKTDPRFVRADETLLATVAGYVARALEAVPQPGRRNEYVARPGGRATLSLSAEGELTYLSSHAVKLLLLAHNGVTPDSVRSSVRREDFPTLTTLWLQHTRVPSASQDPVVLTVDNAWGRFVFESELLAPLDRTAPPLVHVSIQQSEPASLGLHRAIGELPLTHGQRTVCTLLHAGHTAAEIAAALAVAPSTVADHIKKIYARLDVHSQRELIERIDRGLHVGSPRAH